MNENYFLSGQNLFYLKFINPSTHQLVNPSTRQLINSSTHQLIYFVKQRSTKSCNSVRVLSVSLSLPEVRLRESPIAL